MIEKIFDKLFSDTYAQFGSVVNTASETGAQTQSGVLTFLETIRAKFPGWVAGAVVVLLSFMLASIAKKVVINKVSEHLEEDNKAILVLVGRTTYVGVLSVGLAIGLSFWGIQIDALLAAFGIGLAFALRDIMTNFIAGVLILVSRQFRIGDFIQVGSSIKGKVQEIQSRATILKGLDGTKIIVPNKDIFNKPVISFTTNPFRRIEVKMGVDYRTNISLATDIIMDVLVGNKGTLKEPKPQVLTTSFGESSIDLSIRFWVDSDSSWTRTRSHIIEQIQKSFKEAKITIPWPIRTVVYDKDLLVEEGNKIEMVSENESDSGPANNPSDVQTTNQPGQVNINQAEETPANDENLANINQPVMAMAAAANDQVANTETPINQTENAASNNIQQEKATPEEIKSDEKGIPSKPKAEDTGASFLQNE